MKYLMMITFVFLGCSVKNAFAPGKPPVTNNKTFSADTFRGTFSAKNPILFLWPTERDGVMMTHNEQVDNRALIVGLSDEVNAFKSSIKIESNKIRVIAGQFINKKCYSYCDPNDFDCSPDIVSADKVFAWKAPADDAEEKTINSCKENQEERQKIREEIIDPLGAQAREKFVEFLGEINKGKYFETAAIKIIVKDQIVIELEGFQGKTFSSTSGEAELKIGSINYDKKNGYFSFRVPAVESDEEGNLEIYGDYTFNLEIGDPSEEMTLGGEIRFTNNRSLEVKTGRASFTGPLTQE